MLDSYRDYLPVSDLNGLVDAVMNGMDDIIAEQTGRRVMHAAVDAGEETRMRDAIRDRLSSAGVVCRKDWEQMKADDEAEDALARAAD